MEQTTAWQQANYQYLVSEIATLKQQLADNSQTVLLNTAAVSDGAYALDKLVEAFGLSMTERQLLLLCLGCELDPEVAELCRQLHGYPYPTVRLCLALTEGASALLAPDSPLRYWQLVNMKGPSLLNNPITLSAWTVGFLFGHDSLDSSLLAVSRNINPSGALFDTHQTLIEQTLSKLPASVVVQLLGEFSAGGSVGRLFPAGEVMAKAIADNRGYRLHRLNMHYLEELSTQEALYYGRWLQREAKVKPISYALDIKRLTPAFNQEMLTFTPVNHRIKQLVLALQEAIPQQVILYGPRPWKSSAVHLIHLNTPLATSLERD